MMKLTAYLAPCGLEEELKHELKGIQSQYGRLILADGEPQKVFFTQNIWLNPQVIPFHSLSDAAKKLRSLQGLWAFYPYKYCRKGALITEKLPFFSPKPLTFPSLLPKAPLGSFTLLDANTLLASPVCSSPFANGEVNFLESKLPPSRAYLKLWEFFTLMGIWPKKKEVCLDMGASPGGWTFVLQQLGALVIAVDRSPLAFEIANAPNTTFLKKDAFSLDLEKIPKLDWIFCDVAAYPEKLLLWLKKWESKIDANFVCTIKFQGKTNFDIIKEFEKIGSLCHLYHNKHELTWYKLRRIA